THRVGPGRWAREHWQAFRGRPPGELVSQVRVWHETVHSTSKGSVRNAPIVLTGTTSAGVVCNLLAPVSSVRTSGFGRFFFGVVALLGRRLLALGGDAFRGFG